MNLTTQIQRQLAAVEAQGTTCLRSLISFAECLNRTHFDFWNKPDDELQRFLQALLDDGNLETLFADHQYYATSTNNILTRYGSSPICNTGTLKKFTIEDGVIVITPPVVASPNENVTTDDDVSFAAEESTPLEVFDSVFAPANT
jgi:hypothetical protein